MASTIAAAVVVPPGHAGARTAATASARSVRVTATSPAWPPFAWLSHVFLSKPPLLTSLLDILVTPSSAVPSCTTTMPSQACLLRSDFRSSDSGLRASPSRAPRTSLLLAGSRAATCSNPTPLRSPNRSACLQPRCTWRCCSSSSPSATSPLNSKAFRKPAMTGRDVWTAARVFRTTN